MTTFIFIDESGDIGLFKPEDGNSSYYAEAALQVNSSDFEHLMKHLTNWRYFKSFFREAKRIPAEKDIDRFLNPIRVLHDEGLIHCSCVYVDKEKYIGKSLGEAPLKFRNFVHRQLLEFHFGLFRNTNDTKVEVIFDRFEMSKDELLNAENYLKGNWNLTGITLITYVDSIYCDALQLVGQIVNSMKHMKEIPEPKVLTEVKKFLPIKDISSP